VREHSEKLPSERGVRGVMLQQTGHAFNWDQLQNVAAGLQTGQFTKNMVQRANSAVDIHAPQFALLLQRLYFFLLHLDHLQCFGIHAH
jgi:hypothetical protein